MTTFPKAPHLVVPAMIRGAATTLKLHAQQIASLQTRAAATSTLIPGAWDTIEPLAGWSNVSGAIPFQARLLTTTTVQLIANLEGGTTANGTVIGQMASGFFNTVHSHTFSVTAVAGAASVANAVSQGTISTAQRELIPTGTHVWTSFPVELGPGYVQFDNFDSEITLESQTTPVNYNGPACTLSTSGTLTIYNLSSAVTQISFHEASLPLFTA
jgi:hypothetical protein